MPRYKVHINFGFVGARITDEIEAESQEAADELVWEMATQLIDCAAVLIEENASEEADES